MSHLAGLIAAPYTPFDAAGSVNLKVIPRLAKQLAADGVIGAFVCGTTGEGVSLTNPERMSIVEAWVQAAAPGFKVMAQVGHSSPIAMKELAEHAASVGVFAVGAKPINPLMPKTVAAAVEFAESVAAAVPGTPFFYYHIPSVTGVHIRIVDFLRLAGNRIPNLAGVKYTFEDLTDYSLSELVGDGRFDLLYGRDQMLLPALAIGARAAVGSNYNFAAPAFQAILDAFDSGNLALARQVQLVTNEALDHVKRFPVIAAHKHLMKRLGVDVGDVRPPLPTLTQQQRDELDAYLDAGAFAQTFRRGVPNPSGDDK